jgi:hypothetical protein
MTLGQEGSRVTGTYAHDNGKIEGTAAGPKLTGRWSEAPTYAGPRDAGPVELTMSADGKTFTGVWAYEGQALGGSWTGTRVTAP